ncbi:SMI1/KNR4 family protein [Actinoplanes sp. NPDC024001]|uniref:SMI1/KNR4 family protein n=1 Tax=Actinoplanes sp. NPDC024001 TaxID=3154598 RepID=UPI00340FDF4A
MSWLNEFVERLVALVPPPPPRSQVDLPDWDEVERTLGFPLPEDYKELVNLYGPGTFDDFLVVFQPNSSSQYSELTHAIAEGADSLRSYADSGEALPVPIDQLLAIAGTDNGDTVYWVREPGASPDRWRIGVNGARDFDEWYLYESGLAQFLVSVLSREWVVPAFPEDFPYPDRAPVFNSRLPEQES